MLRKRKKTVSHIPLVAAPHGRPPVAAHDPVKAPAEAVGDPVAVNGSVGGDPVEAEIAPFIADRQKVFPMRLAPRVFACLFHGEQVEQRTVRGWCTRGLKGMKLPRTKCRGVWHITAANLQAFVQRANRVSTALALCGTSQALVQPVSATRVQSVDSSDALAPVSVARSAALAHPPPPIAPGLLAAQLAPAGGSGGDFARFLDEYTSQYNPQTRDESNLVAMLARETMRLVSIERCLDELTDPGPMDDPAGNLPTAVGTVEQEQHGLDLLQQMAASLAAGGHFTLSGGDLAQMTYAIDIAVIILEDEREGRKRLATEARCVPAADSADRYRRIQPATLGLTKAKQLKAILTGQCPVPADRRQRWLGLLEYLRQLGRARLKAAQAYQVHCEDRRRQRESRQIVANDKKIKCVLKTKEALFQSIKRIRIQLHACQRVRAGGWL